MNQTLESIPELPGPEFLRLNEIEPPKWHWFYQRRPREGEFDKFGQPKTYPVFACGEAEAAQLDPNKFTQVGASDGTTFFNYMRERLKPNTVFKAQDAYRIEKEAFDAELAVARGKYRRPRAKERFFGSASQGTTGVEEFKANWLGR